MERTITTNLVPFKSVKPVRWSQTQYEGCALLRLLLPRGEVKHAIECLA